MNSHPPATPKIFSLLSFKCPSPLVHADQLAFKWQEIVTANLFQKRTLQKTVSDHDQGIFQIIPFLDKY